MSVEDENVALLRRLYEAYDRGDVRPVLEALDEGVQWVVNAPSGFAWSGTHDGSDAVIEVFENIAKQIEIRRYLPQAYVAQGDRVAVWGLVTAAPKGGDADTTIEWAHFYTLRDGHIVEFREFFDTATAAAALTA